MKEVKRVNTFFLILVILHVGASFIVSLLSMQAVKLGTYTSLMLTQLLILVPSFMFFLFLGYDILSWIPFKKLKGGTVALVVLFTFLIMPFVSFINVFSQLFAENVAVDMMSEMADLNPFINLIIVGFIGPFCEEFTFRGVIYGGLRKSGYIVFAAAITGVYFGLMHLNINQFSYALLLGFILSLLVEATGSIWSSIIAHVIVNSWNMVMMLLADRLYSSIGIDVFKEAAENADTDTMLVMMGFLLVISVATSMLAAGVYIGICSHEGRLDHIKKIFKRKDAGTYAEGEEESDGKVHVITASGYLAMGLCIFVIFFLNMVLTYLIK